MSAALACAQAATAAAAALAALNATGAGGAAAAAAPTCVLEMRASFVPTWLGRALPRASTAFRVAVAPP